MTTNELAVIERRYQRASKTAEALRVERNASIRLARAEGMTHAKIAEATGLSRGRIGQIEHGGKPHQLTGTFHVKRDTECPVCPT